MGACLSRMPFTWFYGWIKLLVSFFLVLCLFFVKLDVKDLRSVLKLVSFHSHAFEFRRSSDAP
jgi:hypothetical protein